MRLLRLLLTLLLLLLLLVRCVKHAVATVCAFRVPCKGMAGEEGLGNAGTATSSPAEQRQAGITPRPTKPRMGAGGGRLDRHAPPLPPRAQLIARSWSEVWAPGSSTPRLSISLQGQVRGAGGWESSGSAAAGKARAAAAGTAALVPALLCSVLPSWPQGVIAPADRQHLQHKRILLLCMGGGETGEHSSMQAVGRQPVTAAQWQQCLRQQCLPIV